MDSMDSKELIKKNPRVQFIENVEVIEKMLSEGYPSRKVWSYLREKKKITMAYRTFWGIINEG